MGWRRSHKLSLIFRRKLWSNLPQASQEKQSKRNRAHLRLRESPPSYRRRLAGPCRPEAFVRIVAESSKFANVSHNIGSLIVRDHVRTRGESMEEFSAEAVNRTH